jgi:hypothetical protein
MRELQLVFAHAARPVPRHAIREVGGATVVILLPCPASAQYNEVSSTSCRVLLLPPT